MAFAKGQVSTENVEIKRYVGVAPVTVLAVNPDKNRLEEIYGTTINNIPEYVGKVNIDGNDIPQVRIDFILKTDAEKCNVDMITKLSIFVRKTYRFNRDQSKVQVIDKYGRTAWVTKEQCKNHEIPVYSNGPANLDKDYRPCYIGEEELTNFIKTYLRIPNVMKYVNNTWVMNDNTEDSVARLDCIDNYFNNNFREIIDCIALQPNNKIKVLLGVKTTDDNKQYQTVYSQMFLSNSTTDYTKLGKEVSTRQANGGYSTTEFFIGDVKEYSVTPTDLSTPSNVDNPFGDTMSDLPWD